MNAKELKQTLKKMIPANLPVLIKGAPGIGKSDIVMQTAKELDYDIIISHPVISDPTDYKGLPAVVNGEAEFLPYGDLRKLLSVKKKTICFLDDIGQAPAVVQAALMQLLLARQINGVKIDDKVIFVAATNRREDKAGVTGVLSPVKSRFAAILELNVDPEIWIEWAFENDMPAALIGFVHFRPSLLSEAETTNDIVNHPCPRTFAFAGKLMNLGITSQEVLAGAVGEGCATELVGFMKVYKELPNINHILLKPEEAPIPQNPASLYAVVSALVEKATEENSKNIFTYGDRLPIDFNILLVRDLIRKCSKIQNTKHFTDWVVNHKNVFI